MPSHKSRVVGPARRPDGQSTTAYRALVRGVCGACGAEIAVGDLFSRHARSGRGLGLGLTRVPLCTTCLPLRLEGDGGGQE